MRRSFISVCIGTGIELAVQDFATIGKASSILYWLILLLLWGDLHFYTIHRTLHLKILFGVHKVHHESTNPHPFSSLSFHPFESALFFSSLLLVFIYPFCTFGAVLPYFAFRSMMIGFILFPTFGHWGHGIELANWHQRHHEVSNCNFGNTLLFDWIFGTAYDSS